MRGKRRAMHQDEHERINAREYPGTRQLCVECDEPTGRCEEDEIVTEDGHGPLCVECWHLTDEWKAENPVDPSDDPLNWRDC